MAINKINSTLPTPSVNVAPKQPDSSVKKASEISNITLQLLNHQDQVIPVEESQTEVSDVNIELPFDLYQRIGAALYSLQDPRNFSEIQNSSEGKTSKSLCLHTMQIKHITFSFKDVKFITPIISLPLSSMKYHCQPSIAYWQSEGAVGVGSALSPFHLNLHKRALQHCSEVIAAAVPLSANFSRIIASYYRELALNLAFMAHKGERVWWIIHLP